MTDPRDLTLCVNFLKGRKEAGSFTDDELLSIAEQALSIGEKTAVDYKGKDLAGLAEELKISMQIEKGGLVGTRLMRAHYDDSVRCITVYEDGLDQILSSGRLEELGLPGTYENVRDMLLWHEFFHALEFRRIGMVGKDFPVIRKVLGFTVRKPFYAVSELSAHAFVRDILNLRRLPMILDGNE